MQALSDWMRHFTPKACRLQKALTRPHRWPYHYAFAAAFHMNPDWQAFLSNQGAHVENGLVRGFAVSAGAKAEALLADLSHEGIIAVEGPDARSFLQGQLSTDLDALTPDRSQLSSWSTAKGRVVTVLRIVPRDERILLLLPRELLTSVLKRLSMYVLRAKVTLTDVSDKIVHIGLAGTDAARLLEAAAATN